MTEAELAKHIHDQQGRRRGSYPSIEEQLDMLYHDIKSGNLSDGSWVAAIEAVKQQFPKS